MVKVRCPLCDKDFRGEGGLNWHLNRIHEENKEATEIDILSGKPPRHELRYDGVQIKVLQDNVELNQQQTEEITDCVGQLSNLVAQFKDRVDELDRRISSLDSLNKQVEDQETRFAALKDENSELQTIILSLSRLVWGLDQDHTGERRLADTVLSGPSGTELSRARECLRQLLHSNVKPSDEAKRVIDSLVLPSWRA